MSKLKQNNLRVSVLLNASKNEEELPNVALYTLDLNGMPENKVASADDGELEIPLYLGKEDVDIAFGPDVEDFKELDRNSLLRYSSARKVNELQRRPVLEVAKLDWGKWLLNRICLSGKARKCFFFFPRPNFRTLADQPSIKLSPAIRKAQLNLDLLTPPLVINCLPLCHGIVEIYKRTCCCNIWDLIPRIPELIPEIPELIPDPGPLKLIPRQIRLASATVEPARKTFIAEHAHNDLKALLALDSPQQKFNFLDARPHLVHILCWNRTCTNKKIGETSLGLDGKFSFCYNQPFVFQSVLRRCYTTYYYKVKQWIGGQYVYVYDGEASKAYFNASQDAVLSTYNPKAETCGNYTPPVDGHGKRYVMLQRLGSTDSHNLNSQLQASATGINKIAPANAGLIDFSSENDCPLASVVPFLLYIDPSLVNVGVQYYRFSLVRSDSSGNAIGTPTILKSTVAWQRFVNGVFPPKVEVKALGPKVVGGKEGLFSIPYVNSSNKWLGAQFHYKLDTRLFANGKYNLILELFDNAGNRVRPTGAAGAGTDVDFHYLKWDNATDTSVVPYAALIHNISINNTKCFADIVDLRVNSSANSDPCQFKTGKAGDRFSVGFQAYQNEGFLRNYHLEYQKGFNGSFVTIENEKTNVLLLKQSAELTFSQMLGADPKCTFSLRLRTFAKHTNGSTFIREYDAQDNASFALEIV